MPYQIIVSPKVKHILKKFDRQLLKKVDRLILGLADDPFPRNFKHLTDLKSASYRIRFGDYRILYDVDTKRKIVFMLKIGHRKEIYR